MAVDEAGVLRAVAMAINREPPHMRVEVADEALKRCRDGIVVCRPTIDPNAVEKSRHQCRIDDLIDRVFPRIGPVQPHGGRGKVLPARIALGAAARIGVPIHPIT